MFCDDLVHINKHNLLTFTKRAIKVSASSIPLKILNSDGDLREFTPIEENYLAYAVGQAMLNPTDVGALAVGASGVAVGSYVDTYFNESPGTHPASQITSGSTTTTLRQVAGPASETGENIPVGYYESDPNPGFYEMVDADLTNLAKRVLGNMVENDYIGTYKLASSSPGSDYTLHIANVFSDTRG